MEHGKLESEGPSRKFKCLQKTVDSGKMKLPSSATAYDSLGRFTPKKLKGHMEKSFFFPEIPWKFQSNRKRDIPGKAEFPVLK